MSADELSGLIFQVCGVQTRSVRIPNGADGRPRGIAFATCETQADADRVVETLNGRWIGDRTIRACQGRERREDQCHELAQSV